VLVISRKAGEGLVLTCPNGEQIEVVVTDIRRIGTGRPYCKLGIEAPRAVLIRRDELPEVITEGQLNAANRDHE